MRSSLIIDSEFNLDGELLLNLGYQPLFVKKQTNR